MVVGGPVGRLDAALTSGPMPFSTSLPPRNRTDSTRPFGHRRPRAMYDRSHRRALGRTRGHRLTRDAGRYVVVGQYSNVGPASFQTRTLTSTRSTLRCVDAGQRCRHVYRSIQVMAPLRPAVPLG